MNHHIIYRQKATVRVVKEAQAYAMQNEISDVMKHELPQLLQDVFDSVNPGGDIIRIDSLHLDLGTLPEQNTGQVFKERVAEKIREAIVISKKNDAPKTGVNTIRKQQSLREAFFYFLQTGTKPWFMGTSNRKAWEHEIQQAFAQDDWQKIILWLRQNHQQQPVIIGRLIHQFSNDFINSIISLTISFGKEKWENIYQDLFHLYKEENKVSEYKTRSKILQLCISAFLKEASLPDALHYVVKELVDEDVIKTAIQSAGVINSTDRSIQTGIVNEVLGTLWQEIYLSLKKRNAILDKADDNEVMPESESRNADMKSTDHSALHPDIKPENKNWISPDKTHNENRNTDSEIHDQHLLHSGIEAQNSEQPSDPVHLESGNNIQGFKDFGQLGAGIQTPADSRQ